MTTTDDPPITKEELYQLHQIRVGKEPTRAYRRDMYFDPARFAGIKLKTEEEANGKTSEAVQQSRQVKQSQVRR